MNEPGFSRFPAQHHHLDPAAQEFFPTSTYPSVLPQIFYPYAPPPHQFPGYVSAAAEPPPPVSFPPSSAPASRTLLLSLVPTTVSESTIRRELEVFGDVRAVQMERRREGLVTVHFYDVRDAQAALLAIQDQHMQQQFRLGRHYGAVLTNSLPLAAAAPPPPPPQAGAGLISGRVAWAQFATPVTAGLPDGNNQGTIVIFNLDPVVSPSYLREIFEAYGPVKELRETPNKRNQRFVEFYDVRNAAKAMAAMNGKEIFGQSVVIEFSRPGGQCRKLWRTPSNGCYNSSRNSFKCSPPPSRPSPPHRNNNFRRGNPSGSNKSSSSGGSSSLSNLFDECLKISRTNNKKNVSKKNDGGSSGGGSSKQSTKPWKGCGGGGGGRHGKDHDPRFLINEDAIMESNCRDSRTTVMIKNIPNKYSQKLLLNMLDNHCIHCNEQIDDGDDQPLSSYDFVYLPIDFINKCNVGYGFVNMTSPQATLRLYKAFHHQNWEVFNSRKICEVTYARLQGLEALREHFKNSKFPGDQEEYMPVVFSPPRDGRNLTAPVPIVGGAVVGSPAGSLPSVVFDGEDDGADGSGGCSYYENDDDYND